MKNFCRDLGEHVTKIINYENKEMIPLTKKEDKKDNKQKVLVQMITIKNSHKVKDVIILGNIEVLLMISAT